MKYNLPFTTDQFHRVMTNLSVTTHRFWYRNKVDFTEDDRNDLYQAIEDVRDITYQLYSVYASQFNHSSMVRKICPNTDCHGVYAIFWTDWEYCPRCGTKLKITRDVREEETMENTENWKHINFELWCPSCIHQDEEESDPYLKCHDCLEEGARINSQKPVNYKEKANV